ncbi:uncharacterized protein SETTUDRAFT_162643 [Exserohilum turcica Et28A]|uniref:Uncharacterized protein n=1 Tax=Exserohilum turcicum (strain 28A) TaxID=671987 RepID=R0KWV2_EXST2|nr:uncharacterized protein SETTUDRAFT_162643 [Exserohilum turcica Et28A]EOA92162.1 hypothetical protein SETTUDRAFT_162643 [Exserohilum turcica Et28A]
MAAARGCPRDDAKATGGETFVFKQPWLLLAHQPTASQTARLGRARVVVLRLRTVPRILEFAMQKDIVTCAATGRHAMA